MCSLGKGWRLVEKNFGVKIVACQFEPMLRVKCVISVPLAAPNRISPHLPLIDPAIGFELYQADWVARTNRARFSKTHAVFTQISKPQKITQIIYTVIKTIKCYSFMIIQHCASIVHYKDQTVVSTPCLLASDYSGSDTSVF